MKPSRAFTLVELLVVVAIIAVLIALLLPAFNKARESARTTICLSNQRDVGIALFAYATDNVGMIPGPSWYTQNVGYSYWHKVLQGRLLGATGTAYIKPPALSTLNNPVLYCPKNGTFYKGQPYSRPGTYGMVNSSQRYGQPAEPSYYKRPTPTPVPDGFEIFQGSRLTSVQKPSNFMMVGDTSIEHPGSITFRPDEGCWSWKTFTSTNTGGTYEAGLWAVHFNQVNGWFADGHSETCNSQRLFSTSNLNGNPGRPTGISWWRNEDFTNNEN